MITLLRLMITAGVVLFVWLLVAPISGAQAPTYPMTLRVYWIPASGWIGAPPGTGIDYYTFKLNDGPVVTVKVTACTNIECSHTFTIPTAGPHTVELRSGNSWGVSEARTHTFAVGLPQIIQGDIFVRPVP